MQVNTDGCTKFEINELKLYRKKVLDSHFIASLDVATEGKKIIVPTLEGNVAISASPEQYIMIGPCNDIYPIPKKLFDERYDVIDEESCCEMNEQIANWNIKKLKRCRLKKETYVYAKEVSTDFQVYVKHSNSIIGGKPGDFYAVSYEDHDNAYIIDRTIMKKTYELIK